MRYIAVTASEERALEVQADWPGTVVTKVTDYTYTVTYPDPSSDAVIDNDVQGDTAETAPSRATTRLPRGHVVKGGSNARRIA